MHSCLGSKIKPVRLRYGDLTQDTVPVAVLDSCAMILHALEELTLARLRDDASMLDALLERLISLTRLFRPLQLGEAYLWSIVNKVKALVLEQEEAVDSS